MRTKVIEKNAYPFLEKRTLATARLLEKLVDDIARALLTFHLVYFSRRSVLLFFCVFALRFHAIQRRFRVLGSAQKNGFRRISKYSFAAR